MLVQIRSAMFLTEFMSNKIRDNPCSSVASLQAFEIGVYGHYTESNGALESTVFTV